MKPELRQRISGFIDRNKALFLLSYFAIYLPWFGHLEKTVTTHFHVIHTALDDYIPFCEYFIIPYLLWFGYVGWGIGYFYLKDRSEYFRLCAMLFTGMTIFLIVSTIYPNGHYLRPTTFARDNIFVHIVKWLYASDTATNLFPSIHVYNSIAVNIAVWRSDAFKHKHAMRCGSAILMVSIILSTMFLKQHSVSDVCCALVMNAGTCMLLYRPAKAGNALRTREKKRNIECKNGNGRPAHQKVRGPDGLGRERMGDEWDGSAGKMECVRLLRNKTYKTYKIY